MPCALCLVQLFCCVSGYIALFFSVFNGNSIAMLLVGDLFKLLETCMCKGTIRKTHHSNHKVKLNSRLAAMVRPVFEGEKWRRLDSNLCVCYRLAFPSGSP